MNERNTHIVSAVATAIVMGLIAVLLLECGMSAVVPDSEQGLTVNFGAVDLSAGLFEPYAEQPQQVQEPTPAQPAAQPEPVQEELMTQAEESVALEAQQAREKAEKEAEEARRREEERIKQEQERQKNQIDNLAANAFGSPQGAEAGNDQGSGETPAGNQGQLEGNIESVHFEGSGSGEGYNWTLDGRGLVNGMPKPAYEGEAEGIVRVEITVSPDGRVIKADATPDGTTTDDMKLRKAAENAARSAQFNAISGHNDAHGYITYHFRLK